MSSRKITIKTNVVNRLVKEVASYKSEALLLQARVEKMEAENQDVYEVRQQRRVHADSLQMIPDSEKRLAKSVEELEALIASTEDELKGTEELELAKKAVASVPSLIKFSKAASRFKITEQDMQEAAFQWLLTDPTQSPISTLSAELLLRILDLARPTTHQLLKLALLARRFTPPAQTLLFRDVRFPRKARKGRSHEDATVTNVKSVPGWLERLATGRFFTRSLDLKGVKDSRTLVDGCPGVKELWNLEIDNDWSILKLPGLSGLQRLEISIKGHFKDPPRSTLKFSFNLIHLDFTASLDDLGASKLFHSLSNSSISSLQHLNLMECLWTATSRKNLLDLLSLLDGGRLPSRLLSLGLPFARDMDSQDSDSDSDEGKAEKEDNESDVDEFESDEGDYLSKIEHEFLSKCTYLRTFGGFRLPSLKYCPPTVTTFIMWFSGIFPHSGFEDLLFFLKPQLRTLKCCTVERGENLGYEEWFREFEESGEVEVLCDDRAGRLRFGFI
ncbi:tubulin-specific chaperone A, partial [Phenoliferia sp. Uapishka_3]